MVRAGGAAVLDYRFERRSPIPVLAGETLELLQSRKELVLPPTPWTAPGNQSYSGLTFLIEMGRFLKASRVFEIGTYNGATAWCLARNLPETEVHTLDLPFEQDPSLAYGVSDVSNRIRFEQRAYEVLPMGGSSVVQHWGDSATFDFGSWRRSVDLVYVDGAHSHDYVRADSATAFELVRESGAIVWDDYWRRVPGVRAALHDLSAPLFRVPGTRLVVYFAPAAVRRIKDARLGRGELRAGSRKQGV
jgi:predicted O-methyltransferase YrrM